MSDRKKSYGVEWQLKLISNPSWVLVPFSKIPFPYLPCWWPILTGAFHLCHLDVPLPGGTGVRGADDGVDRVTRGAGI